MRISYYFIYKIMIIVFIVIIMYYRELCLRKSKERTILYRKLDKIDNYYYYYYYYLVLLLTKCELGSFRLLENFVAEIKERLVEGLK